MNIKPAIYPISPEQFRSLTNPERDIDLNVIHKDLLVRDKTGNIEKRQNLQTESPPLH